VFFHSENITRLFLSPLLHLSTLYRQLYSKDDGTNGQRIYLQASGLLT
jgi:hypothetical protein